MSQARLINSTGRTVNAGELVRINPKNINSFLVAKLTDYGIIGTASSSIKANQYGMINLINTVAWTDVQGRPVDYTQAEKTKLAATPTFVISATPPVNPAIDTIWIVPQS